MEIHWMIVAVVLVAVFFDFANGWNDSANAIATVVCTRVLSPFQAVMLAAVFNFLGAYLSTRVAKTIGGSLVDPYIVTQPVVLLAMVAASIWVMVATYRGLPISASHSLIGGLIGAAVAVGGLEVLKMKGLILVLAALFLSPLLGMGIAFVSMKVLARGLANIPHGKVNRIFGRFQVVSSGWMALSHGTNDAQKAMGVITLALFSGGYLTELDVPLWVISVCALAMSLGTATGGWRVIKTLGTGLMDLKPIHGFMAETSATVVLFGAAALGVPVSTTHVITSSIVGVGAANRPRGVQWSVGKKIGAAWVLTFPFCIGTSFLLLKLFNLVL